MSQETKNCHACTHHDQKHHHHHDQKFTNEKSLVVLDVKPKEVTTDLQKVKESIQNIYADGLSWGESKIEEVAYGIKKLVIGAIVKDRVSVEDLIEKIKKVDGVQDVDVASFNEV